MLKYIVKRLIMFIPVVLGVALVIFVIMDFTPGDPARIILGEMATQEQIDALTEEMGLNDPILVRYVRYIWGLLHGDFGTSYKSKLPVMQEIAARFPNTVLLAFASAFCSVLFALPLGIVAAVKQNSAFDTFSMIVALVGVSIPGFWLGLMMMLLFSLKLGWLPASGSGTILHLIMPAVALGFLHMASIARTVRSSMLEVIRQDYIRTARSKGLPYGTVIRRHALKNALIPTVTVVGLQIGEMLGGAVLTETVFAWPGVGRLMIQGIQGRDTPMVLGCLITLAVSFSVVNLIVDLLYGFIDPRLKAQFK